MLVKIREDVFARTVIDGIEFYGKNSFKLKTQNENLKAFAMKLEDGIDVNLKFNNLEAKLIDKLNDKGILINYEFSNDRNAIWEAHLNVNGPLKNKSVLVIGVGGTGSIIADHLARFGVLKIGIVDGAKLDSPDLNRQFCYKKENVGKYKVDLLKDHIESQTNCKVVESYREYLNSSNLDIFKKDYDLIINCADKPKFEIQCLAVKLSQIKKIPILFGSVGILDYVVGPFLNSESKKEKFLQTIYEEKKLFSFSNKVIKGSNPILNTLASVEIAKVAYEYLAGLEKLHFEKIEYM